MRETPDAIFSTGKLARRRRKQLRTRGQGMEQAAAIAANAETSHGHIYDAILVAQWRVTTVTCMITEDS